MSVKNKTFYKTYAYIKSITITPLLTLCITSNHFLKNAKSFSFSDAYHNFVFALEDPREKCRNLIWTFKNYFLKKGLDERNKIKLKQCFQAILFIGTCAFTMYTFYTYETLADVAIEIQKNIQPKIVELKTETLEKSIHQSPTESKNLLTSIILSTAAAGALMAGSAAVVPVALFGILVVHLSQENIVNEAWVNRRPLGESSYGFEPLDLIDLNDLNEEAQIKLWILFHAAQDEKGKLMGLQKEWMNTAITWNENANKLERFRTYRNELEEIIDRMPPPNAQEMPGLMRAWHINQIFYKKFRNITATCGENLEIAKENVDACQKNVFKIEREQSETLIDMSKKFKDLATYNVDNMLNFQTSLVGLLLLTFFYFFLKIARNYLHSFYKILNKKTNTVTKLKCALPGLPLNNVLYKKLFMKTMHHKNKLKK